MTSQRPRDLPTPQRPPQAVSDDLVTVLDGAVCIPIEFIRRCYHAQSSDIVLATSSLVEGLGNKFSDLDIYVFRNALPRVEDIPVGEHHRVVTTERRVVTPHLTAHPDERVALIHTVVPDTDIKVDVEFRTLDQMSALFDKVARLFAYASTNLELFAQRLQDREASLVHRVFSARPIQNGHMFAPRPAVAIREMLRVLKPGGTIAFSTWPPEGFVGRVFSLIAKYAPPPPEVSPPTQWGSPDIVRERLGAAVTDVHFERDLMQFQILSPQHYRVFMESTGLATGMARTLKRNNPEEFNKFRSDLEALAAQYFRDNLLQQDYLLTRALKVSV